MTEKTLDRWSTSPAQKLTLGNYLPEFEKTDSGTSIFPEEQGRKSDAVDIIQLSGEEFGRTHLDRRIYLEAIGQKYGEVDFLARAEELKHISDLASTGSIDIDAQSPEIKQAIVDDIRGLNSLGEKLFGAIDPERFEAIMARAARDARSLINTATTDAHVVEAAERLLSVIPEADPELVDAHIYKPTSELLETLRPAVEKKYSSLLELIAADKASYNADEIVTLFEQAIEVMANSWDLTRATEWTVQQGKTNINVDMEQKTIWVPTSKTASLEDMRGLMVHEVGGHLLRNLLGEMSGDPFLATDMPGRGSDEEALFTILEQALKGKAREAGVNYCVAIGLATSGQPVPLEDIEQVLVDYVTVTTGKPLTEAQTATAKKQAFRVTRGMPSIVIDGKRHQAVYNADIKYAVGQQNAIAFLEKNIDNPTALDTVMYGKFAYSNADQVSYSLEKHAGNAQALARVPSAA